MQSEFDRSGFFMLSRHLDEETVASLIRDLSALDGESVKYGVRDLMDKVPRVRELASLPLLTSIVEDVLGKEAMPVRSVFFDKLPEANWNVAWHQDTSIALKARHDTPGFGPWSEKQGVVHAEPPEEFLANTVTLRIHLDPSNSETGVLRVVPGTHRGGRVPSGEILKIVERSEVIECDAAPGDVLVMSPLLFHSSRKAATPTHRRIIHIEYSSMELPGSLEWHECA